MLAFAPRLIQLLLILEILSGFEAKAQQYSYGTYSLFPQGPSRAMGIGGAYTAVSDNAAGMMFNPAGLALGKWSFDAGGTYNEVSNKEAAIFGIGVPTNLSYNFIFGAAAARLGSWVIGAGVSSPYYLDYSANTINNVQAKLIITSGDFLIARKFSENFAIGIAGHTQSLQTSYSDNSNGQVSTTSSSSHASGGIVYRDGRFTLGLSYTPVHGFDVNSSLNSQLSGVTWFRDCIIPAKASAGISFRFASDKMIVVDVDKFDAIQNAIVVGTGTNSGQPAVLIVSQAQTVLHGGVEWNVVKGSGNDVIFRFGGYNEPSRITVSSARTHMTVGLDVRFGPVILTVAFDQASDFTNTAQGFVLSFGAF